jgi:hypothetical protein
MIEQIRRQIMHGLDTGKRKRIEKPKGIPMDRHSESLSFLVKHRSLGAGNLVEVRLSESGVWLADVMFEKVRRTLRVTPEFWITPVASIIATASKFPQSKPRAQKPRRAEYGLHEAEVDEGSEAEANTKRVPEVPWVCGVRRARRCCWDWRSCIHKREIRSVRAPLLQPPGLQLLEQRLQMLSSPPYSARSKIRHTGQSLLAPGREGLWLERLFPTFRPAQPR